MSPDSLDEPLPDAASRLGYRAYPAFTRRWLIGRTRIFGFVVIILDTLSVLGALVGSRRIPPADLVAMAASFLIAGLGMLLAGPLLATLVRHSGLPKTRERVLVVLSLIVGIGVAATLDGWSSGIIERAWGSEDAAPGDGPWSVIVGVLIYGSLGGGLALPSYWSEDRRRQLATLRKDKQELDRHLGVLQAQIEPHFLFNTLASIRSLIARRPADAEAMLDSLVAYLRATIPRLRDAKVEHTVGEQLDLCRAYLEIMSARLGRMTHRVEMDPALRSHPFLPFVVLTLVENAVQHGIDPKAGPGRVDVRARREGTALIVEVEDDGVGLELGTGGGLGLRNLREQLRVRYGEHARFELTARPGGGTRAAIIVEEELL